MRWLFHFDGNRIDLLHDHRRRQVKRIHATIYGQELSLIEFVLM